MTTPPNLNTPAEIRQWLTDTMAERGLSTIQWATRAGVATSTLFRALAPDYEFVTSRRTLAKLAAALDGEAPPGAAASGPGGWPGGVPEGWVASTPSRGLPPSRPPEGLGALATSRLTGSVRRTSPALPLRFEVQLGVWYECLGPEFSVFFEGNVPNFEPDGRYLGARQWLELVRDDSADAQILPQSLAHVVNAEDIAYGSRQGDWVVVERARAGGQLFERTIRQVDIRGANAHLTLRSSNPKWSGGGDACVIPIPATPITNTQPTAVSTAPDGGEQLSPAAAGGVVVSIAGLVIGAYRRW